MSLKEMFKKGTHEVIELDAVVPKVKEEEHEDCNKVQKDVMTNEVKSPTLESILKCYTEVPVIVIIGKDSTVWLTIHSELDREKIPDIFMKAEVLEMSLIEVEEKKCLAVTIYNGLV